MYSFVSSIVLPRSIGAQYISRDISAIKLPDVFINYSEVFLTLLDHSVTPSLTVYVRLGAIKEQAELYAGTITEYLVFIGSATLPFTISLPSLTLAYAKYSDAYYAGYKANLSKYNSASIHDPLIDVKLTRPTIPTDCTLVDKNCLVTVNGYLHKTAHDVDSTYIIDAVKSLDVCGNNQIGILSFLDIGTVTKLPLQSGWITPGVGGQLAQDKMYITIPTSTINLANKTVMLSLGGYLVLPQTNVFWPTGEQIFTLDITSLPIIERLFESKKYLDLSSLSLTNFVDKPHSIDVNEFLGATVLTKYLKLSQSFIIIIDTPSIDVHRYALTKNKLHGLYVSHVDPTYPIICGYGKMPEYWRSFEDGQWAMTIEDGAVRNYDFSTIPLIERQIVNSGVVSTNPFKYSEAYFLQITATKV